MSAELSGHFPSGGDPKELQQQLKDLLREKGVRHGIMVEEVRRALDLLGQGQKVERLKVAQATPAKPGADAQVELALDFPEEVLERLARPGPLDLELPSLPLVKPGDVIARLIPPRRGIPGSDVLGRVIRPPGVRRYQLQAGRGVDLSEDGLEVRAAVAGVVVRPEHDRFEVLEVLEIDGDVDEKTGSIQFPGLVKITGTVLRGFRVIADSLVARTLEPGSQIKLRGSLRLSGGCMGSQVVAGGNMRALFVRDSRLQVRGNLVVSTEIVTSRVHCGGTVTILQRDGRIVNSFVAATNGVTTGDIKSSGVEPTVIRLGIRPEQETELASLRRRLDRMREESLQLDEMLIAQIEELRATEQELREMLILLKDPDYEGREALISQVEMIKPMRETLKEGLAEGRRRQDEFEIKIQRMERKIEEKSQTLPKGAVRLVVRGEADPTTEIRGSWSSLSLDRVQRSFMASESAMFDSTSGVKHSLIELVRIKKDQIDEHDQEPDQ